MITWSDRTGVPGPKRGNLRTMKLIRSAAAIGIAKKIYDEARKPENQRRIKQAIEQAKAKQASRGSRRR